MGLKLAIGDNARADIRGYYKDHHGSTRAYEFVLEGVRFNQDEINDMTSDEGLKASEALEKKITGWQNQNLVLQEDDTPAPFSKEAFRLLLNIPGMPGTCLNAYVKACAVTSKN